MSCGGIGFHCGANIAALSCSGRGGCGVSSKNTRTPFAPYMSGIEKFGAELMGSLKTKTVYVYDIDDDRRKVSCLTNTQVSGRACYENRDIEINKLKDYVNTGCFDGKFLIGISVKSNGDFKLRPKDLKPYKDLLKEKIPHFKEHVQHMKDVKKQLKEEREQEENFDYDER